MAKAEEKGGVRWGKDGRESGQARSRQRKRLEIGVELAKCALSILQGAMHALRQHAIRLGAHGGMMRRREREKERDGRTALLTLSNGALSPVVCEPRAFAKSSFMQRPYAARPPRPLRRFSMMKIAAHQPFVFFLLSSFKDLVKPPPHCPPSFHPTVTPTRTARRAPTQLSLEHG